MSSSPRPRATLLAAPLVALGLLLTAVWTPAAGAQTADDLRSRASTIAERLSALEAEQMDLAAEFERANYELSQAEAKVAEMQRYADEAGAELEQRRAEVRAYAVEAYQSSGGGEMDALLKGEPDEAPQARAYIEVTSGSRKDLVDQLNAAEKRAEGEIEQLDAARTEAAAHAEDIEAARNAAAEAVDEQRSVQAEVQGELASLVAAEQARQAEAAAAAAAAAAPAVSTAPSSNATARATAPAAPKPVAPAPLPPTTPAPPGNGNAAAAIPYATSKVGSSYVWGAAGPNVFDCSGLMVWAFAQVGISLPHYSGAIYNMTARISAGQLQPGDFVFWGGGGSEHVALYMGGNQLIHAFGSGGTRITALQGWWKAPSGYGRLG
jgi:cell wall-associated NlpC family hydrolase